MQTYNRNPLHFSPRRPAAIRPASVYSSWSPLMMQPLVWYDSVGKNYAGVQFLTDLSGNGNHAMLGSTTGTDSNDPTWASGGLQFDGVNDFVTPVKPPIDYTNGSWSMFFIFRATQLPDAAYHRVIGGIARTASSSALALVIQPTGYIALDIYGAAAQVGPVNYGMGYALVVVNHNAKNSHKITLGNNAFIQTANYAPVLDSSYGFGLGYSLGGSYFWGITYAAGLIPRVLTSSDISMVYRYYRAKGVPLQ